MSCYCFENDHGYRRNAFEIAINSNQNDKVKYIFENYEPCDDIIRSFDWTFCLIHAAVEYENIKWATAVVKYLVCELDDGLAELICGFSCKGIRFLHNNLDIDFNKYIEYHNSDRGYSITRTSIIDKRELLCVTMCYSSFKKLIIIFFS